MVLDVGNSNKSPPAGVKHAKKPCKESGSKHPKNPTYGSSNGNDIVDAEAG